MKCFILVIDKSKCSHTEWVLDAEASCTFCVLLFTSSPIFYTFLSYFKNNTLCYGIFYDQSWQEDFFIYKIYIQLLSASSPRKDWPYHPADALYLPIYTYTSYTAVFTYNCLVALPCGAPESKQKLRGPPHFRKVLSQFRS